MRQEADFFADRDVILIHISKRLKEALAVEELLTGLGISYAVEADQYQGGFLFRTTRTGAFFYVAEEDETRAVEALEGASIKPLPKDLRVRT